MARGTRWLVVATMGLAFAGCLNRPEPRTTALVLGEMTYECVWSSCSAPTLALSRCNARAGSDAAAFQHCMRDEGYQPFKCQNGQPNCTPRLQILH